MYTGEVAVSELSGPVGIVYATNEAAKSGIVYVIYLAALLSLNLAILNMLPFPALDGGRLLFLVIRLFTGKRVSDETEGKIHFIGICLMIQSLVMVINSHRKCYLCRILSYHVPIQILFNFFRLWQILQH